MQINAIAFIQLLCLIGQKKDNFYIDETVREIHGKPALQNDGERRTEKIRYLVSSS
jgi:hypothetical protein